MKASTYSDQKWLSNLLLDLTLIAFGVSSILITYTFDMTFYHYFSGVLTGFVPSLAIAAFMARMTYWILRRQEVQRIRGSLISIRNCIIQIIFNAESYEMQNCAHEWYWIKIRDYSEKIHEECESIRASEFLHENPNEVMLPSLKNLSDFGRITRQYIDSALCKKSNGSTDQDEDREWIKGLKNVPHILIEAEAEIRKFVGKYCPDDLVEINKVLYKTQLDSQKDVPVPPEEKTTICYRFIKEIVKEMTLLRCYAVFITLFAIFLIWQVNQSTQNYTVETTKQSTVVSCNPLPSRSVSPIEAGVYSVIRVVDGDTLVVGDNIDREKQYRVRLIGTDTPETVKSGTPVEAFGLDASEFTKQMIAESSNRVRIAFDGEQLDRFNRTLAMVWLQMPNGQEVWLNELLIREGLAYARLDYRYSHGAKLAFAVAEVEARKNRKNLWNGERE